jgi:hypothetical protein
MLDRDWAVEGTLALKEHVIVLAKVGVGEVELNLEGVRTLSLQ